MLYVILNTSTILIQFLTRNLEYKFNKYNLPVKIFRSWSEYHYNHLKYLTPSEILEISSLSFGYTDNNLFPPHNLPLHLIPPPRCLLRSLFCRHQMKIFNNISLSDIDIFSHLAYLLDLGPDSHSRWCKKFAHPLLKIREISTAPDSFHHIWFFPIYMLLYTQSSMEAPSVLPSPILTPSVLPTLALVGKFPVSLTVPVHQPWEYFWTYNIPLYTILVLWRVMRLQSFGTIFLVFCVNSFMKDLRAQSPYKSTPYFSQWSVIITLATVVTFCLSSLYIDHLFGGIQKTSDILTFLCRL